MKEKLKCLLDSQIDGLLSRIDEELHSENDRQQYSEQYGHDHIVEENDEEEESYR